MICSHSNFKLERVINNLHEFKFTSFIYVKQIKIDLNEKKMN
jgi:hypothetical protein